MQTMVHKFTLVLALTTYSNFNCICFEQTIIPSQSIVAYSKVHFKVKHITLKINQTELSYKVLISVP